ncbi:pentapeptide repeat-containing protein [Aureispira anguillae]|nr:pentapeptide repeat-containing protein [Aureispira anguillae]
MDNPNTLEIKIDASLANKTFKLFKKLAINSFNIVEIVLKKDIKKGIETLKDITTTDTRFDTPEKKLAFELITEALKKAIQKLREEVFKEYSINTTLLTENKAYHKLINQQEVVFQEGFVIDGSFFKQPKQFALLAPLQELLQELFEAVGLKAKNALNLSLELKEYFVIELHRYWREHAIALKPLDTYFNSPFSSTVENILEWQEYNIKLRRAANSTVFDDSVTLADLYISLRGYYLIKEESEDYLDKDSFIQHVIMVEDSLDEWLTQDKNEDHIRVISGGPGRGKSTLCKIWAAKLTEQVKDWQVLYLPFHLLSLKDSLEQMIEEYLKLPHLPFTQSPLMRLKGSNNKLLLIFDGLDELSAQNLQTADIVRQFIDELRHKLNSYNYDQLHLKVLLTGRDLVIQQCQKIFKTEPQFIHLLPYFIPSKNRHETPYFANYPIQDPNKLLDIDQRNSWWSQYGSQKNESFRNMPEELTALPHLDDITAEPLLNYLVAITWRSDPKIFNQDTNLNTIYEKLISDVYERDYAPKTTHHLNKKIGTKKDFLAILEMIGLAAWQGGNTRATTAEAIDHFIDQIGSRKLKQQFKQYKDNPNTNTDRLFLAFYFKESTKNSAGVPSFEFTHKSFGEYLTARGIISLLKKCNRRFIKFQQDEDEDSRPFESKEAIMELLQISNYPIDGDLSEFIKNEIALMNETDPKRLDTFHDNLCIWINYASQEIETIDQLIPSSQYHLSWNTKLKIHRNLEEMLMIIRISCTEILDKNSYLNFDLQSWCKRTTFFNSNSIGLGSLYQISLQEANLEEANLQKVDLYRSDLQNANLMLSDLRGADLMLSNLQRADFRGADLQETNLQGANLQGANLQQANLERANLQQAQLIGANLRETQLQRTNLLGANLQGANLMLADLREADLLEANLQRVNFHVANLREAYLEKANLQGVNLREADLQGANLREADLQGADFKNAFFDISTLSTAKTLYQSTGLSKKQKEELLELRPDIFDKPKED